MSTNVLAELATSCVVTFVWTFTCFKVLTGNTMTFNLTFSTLWIGRIGKYFLGKSHPMLI